MVPKLTEKVLRGLEIMAVLAKADMEADRSTEVPRYSAREESDFYAALRWVIMVSAAHHERIVKGGRGE